MTSAWFNKGRPALFEVLTGVCDQIGRDIQDGQSSWAKSGAKADQDSPELQAQADKSSGVDDPDTISQLKEQIRKLQSQVADLKSSTEIPDSCAESVLVQAEPANQSQDDDEHTAPPCTDSGDVSTPKCGDCAKVLRRYHALSANFKTAKEALKKRKTERNQWIRHAGFLTRKIKSAEERFNVDLLGQSARNVEVPSAKAREADEGTSFPTLSFMSDDPTAAVDDEPRLPTLPARDASDSEQCASKSLNTQTTQDQTSDGISQHNAQSPLPSGENSGLFPPPGSSSEVPEIVSEREVKKRKRGHGEAQNVAVPLVKTEATESSSPIMMLSPVKLGSQESIDLGDIAQKVQTPRKRDSTGFNIPQTDIIPRSRLEIFTPEQAGTVRHAQSAKLLRTSSVLAPLDVNTRLLRSGTDNARFDAEMRRQRAEGIAELAEDGVTYEQLVPTAAAGLRIVEPSKSRLRNLLESSSERSDIILHLGKSHHASVNREVKLGIPGRRQLPFDRDGQRYDEPGPSPVLLRSKANTASEPSALSESELRDDRRPRGSLRNRPVSELRLTDFKINSSANEGHDFAFAEVVRDKDDRACLPGCTDLHCCGKNFRALAISQRPDAPLTAAQRQDEQKLLEAYLGDYSYRLAAMDPEERLQTWIEAKTQELANRYGKHRHRFARMRSPPGFWDADFPDTQQLRADKEEAERGVRRAVTERHREAMRLNGRWKFADE